VWRIVRWTAAAIVALAVIAGVRFGLWFQSTILDGLPTDLTEYRDWLPLTNVVVRDRRGDQVDRFYVERRQWVPLDELPDHVWQAFVAAEDRRFFEHPGVDALGIARAVLGNLVAGETKSGASTLTQQLVKNLLVGNERSIERKLREAVLAHRLERDVGKQRILELYVNYVALGSGNYGVEAAAQDYFGVSARELDVGQAALIAGLVPAPSRYSPRRWPEVSAQRRALVLGRMVRAGYLSDDEAQAHVAVPVQVAERPDGHVSVAAPYLTEVRREIRQLFGSEAAFRAGLTVDTALDPELQQIAVDAVEDALEAHTERQGAIGVRSRGHTELPEPLGGACGLAQVSSLRPLQLATIDASWSLDAPDTPVTSPTGPKPLRTTLAVGDRLRVCPAGEGRVALDRTPWSQGAAVVVHTATGEVVAVTGGREAPLEGFVRATQARRQPGSSFKPYVYAAALQADDRLDQLSIMSDAPLTIGNWSPKNYSGGYSGPQTLRRALAVSTNTIPIRLTLQVGASRVAATARALGVRTPLRDDPTIALGSSEVTPLDQAVAYATLARGGVPRAPVWIRKVQTADDGPFARAGELLDLGEVSVQLPGAPGRAAVRPEVAYQVVDMMREVVRAGTARRVFDPERDRGAKTGTTNDFVDAWLVGFTANHTIAVWVGTDGVATLGDKETGGRAALPAWLTIAEALDEPVGARVRPPPEVGVVPKEGVPVALPWSHLSKGTGPLPVVQRAR
jgi:penicillin-binding protein 1A